MESRWHHTSLAVANLGQSLGFYQDMFGFRELLRAHLNEEIAAITAEAHLSCELVQLKRPDDARILELIAFAGPRNGAVGAGSNQKPIYAGSAHVAFVVGDLDDALEQLHQLGGRVLGNVVTFGEGKSAYCQEPGGSFVELEELFRNEGV